MKNKVFNLTDNAFYILRAEYISDRSGLTELVEDAEFDEKFSVDVINSAHQSLLAPITRLNEETAWLPELSQSQISNITDLLESGDMFRLEQASKHFPELAKANVLAHLINANSFTVYTCNLLIAAWDEIDRGSILEFLNEGRNKAGFPIIEKFQLDNSLKELEKIHANTTACGVWALTNPGIEMERVVESELKRNPSSSFLERFVRSYDSLSEPDLVRISNEIDNCIENIKSNPKSPSSLVGNISDLLRQWDDINQPVQVYEQNQGHEEGRSKQIFEKIRALCLELANERDEVSSARVLSEALLRTFPELESVAEVLKQDVAQLETLDEQQKQHQLVEPLIEACEAAKSQLKEFKAALVTNGFSQTSKGPVSDIISAFKNALSLLADKSIAFMVIRNLALYINNDRSDPETGFRLINGLLLLEGSRASAELREMLVEDRAILHRNWKMNELENSNGDLSAMLQSIDEMLKYARGAERDDLYQLKSSIERKRAGKKLKWGVYATIAAVVGFLLISEEMNKPPNRVTYQPTYQPSTQRVTTPSVTPNPAITAEVEIKPPTGQGLALNRNQVRYCVFQGERLEAIRPLTSTNFQVDRFNALIDDYNARCANFRYSAGVLTAIEREATSKADEFQADARRIVASW